MEDAFHRVNEAKVILKKLEKEEKKPAEWRDEDKRALNNAIVALSMYVNGEIPYLLPSQLLEDVERLKSLRPSQKLNEEEIKKIRSEEYTKGFNDAAFGGKSKEWSEEDEDRIRQIERIAQAAGCTQKLQEEIHDWLKFRRPKPHTVSVENATKFGNLKYERGVKDGIHSEKSRKWKPSREQIEELLNVLTPGKDFDCDILAEFYEQLKLM